MVDIVWSGFNNMLSQKQCKSNFSYVLVNINHVKEQWFQTFSNSTVGFYGKKNIYIEKGCQRNSLTLEKL